MLLMDTLNTHVYMTQHHERGSIPGLQDSELTFTLHLFKNLTRLQVADLREQKSRRWNLQFDWFSQIIFTTNTRDVRSL